MRTFAFATLLSLPLSAAATPISDSVGAVESVQIDGIVSVPLYTDGDDVARPTIRVTLPGGEENPDSEFFFGLASSSNVIVISDEFRTAAGLPFRVTNRKLVNLMGSDHRFRLGGELKVVVIPEIRIGELVLTNVNALVSDSNHGLDGVHHDLQIGLGAIPQLSWAILPSAGEVRFVDAASGGSDLVASLGTATETGSSDWDDPKFGEDRVLVDAVSLLAPVTIGGSEVQASIEVAETRSSIASSQELSETSAHRSRADRHYYWVDTTIGEATIDGWVHSTSGLERGRHPSHQAVLGAPQLASLDIAYDPATNTLAVSPASDSQWTSQSHYHLADAISAVEEADAVADAEVNGEDGEEAEESGPDVGALATLANAYSAVGQLDAAVSTWEQVVEAEPAICGYQQSLGEAYWAVLDIDAAIGALTEASRLYHTWWDLDLETRTEASDYRSTSESTDFWDRMRLRRMEAPAEDIPESQAGACHVADGLLAAAHLANEDTDSVAVLYDEHLDLDPLLAVARGTASLNDDENQAAHSALRQALSREASPMVDSRIGLAMAYTNDGDWSTAEQHYLRALDVDPHDSILAAAWVDAMVEAEGIDATLRAATEWAESRPGSVAAQYAQVRAAWHAGDEEALQSGAQEAALRVERIARYTLRQAPSLAIYARILALTGDVDSAHSQAEAALGIEPDLGVAYLAMAEAITVSFFELSTTTEPEIDEEGTEATPSDTDVGTALVDALILAGHLAGAQAFLSPTPGVVEQYETLADSLNIESAE